jgi:hypothetical protein
MGGRVKGVFLAGALYGAACIGACATAGDGGGGDAAAPAPDASPMRDVVVDGPPGPSDDASEGAAGDGAIDDVDATVTPAPPDATELGTPPIEASAPGEAGDDTSPDAPLPDTGADAGAAGEGGTDGATDGGTGGATDGATTADGSTGDAAPESGADAGPCGTCASGFSCGPSHYCRTSTGVPAFGRVFVIVLGDTALSAIKGSTSAAYLNLLMSTYAYGTSYVPQDHPSLPNYLELTSGNPQGVACDCMPGASGTCGSNNCSLLTATCTCPQGVSHLGDQLDVAGIPWREYAESMGAPCNPNDGGALFAVNHVPFLYYDDVLMDAARCQQRVRDFTDFAGDLSATSGPIIRYALISPNVCDDMHSNCTGDPVRQGDAWLSGQVPGILGTPGFGPGGSDVLFIVGDELPAALGTGPLPFIVVSPLAKAGPTAGAYDHYSLLATIEDGLGLPRLGQAGTSATIADVWR